MLSQKHIQWKDCKVVMTDSSPGDHGSRKSSAAAADNVSLHSQPSSLLLSEDHYGSNVVTDHSLADDNKFVNGKL